MDRLLNMRIIIGIQGESLSDCTLKFQDFQLNFFSLRNLGFRQLVAEWSWPQRSTEARPDQLQQG